MLRLAGASNISAQRREDPTADSTPTSTPGATGMSRAIPQDTIHPALLQYIQATQGGGPNVQGSFDQPVTDPSKTNAVLSGRSPSGSGRDPSTSSRVPHGMPSNSVGTPPTQQPLPQVPAGSQLWSSFESTQSPFTQGTAGEATYSLDSFSDFDSIFRFHSPFLHTQYPQLSGTTQTFEQTPTTGPSPVSNDLSRGFGEMRMEEARTGRELDPTRFMAGNAPGLAYDGIGTSWEAFLAGWRP